MTKAGGHEAKRANIAVIPARGGSKRISRKNIKLFCGKPLLAYSIAVARASNVFERIIVSTDDTEIAAVARQWGADTPFLRPKELADDYTGTNAVTAHAAAWLLEHGVAVEYVCCLYATVPLLKPHYLARGLEMLRTRRCPFVFSATTFPSAIQRALRLDDQGRVSPFDPRWINSRTQDLEEAYHDAGQFYWGTPESFRKDTLFTSGSSIVVLPRHLVVDIDTAEDWTLAEYMYKTLLALGEIEDRD
ncbi:MAG: pseudaminic acid cytidylyltransferase [Desulfovibrio sp.]|nr:pseudaminic acid cytidylyltransferase [Desulfovibrio sp.]